MSISKPLLKQILSSVTLFFLLTNTTFAQLNLKTLPLKQLCSSTGATQVYLLSTPKERQHGFSDFKTRQPFINTGMYFQYPHPGRRRFWMPNTFFALDIIFLDATQQIVAIERNVPYYPHPVSNRSKVPRTHTYYAKDVIEFPHGTKWVTNLKVGDKLSWCSKVNGL